MESHVSEVLDGVPAGSEPGTIDLRTLQRYRRDYAAQGIEGLIDKRAVRPNSLTNQSEGPFGMIIATRPGEWMQIDSSALDVVVRLGPGDLTTAQPGQRQLPGVRNPVIGECGHATRSTCWTTLQGTMP
jgi:hypothetical protein